MKLLSMALATAGLMALSACGGGSENKAANTSAEDVNVVEENLIDDSLAGNEVGNEAGNAADANAAAGNEAGNVQ
jgi:hypothetical protein